eukprot:GDKI01038993.1.p1 GENE.GDKI01038993.1~~GDKI01038993.1.p1  ORF type:complete len:106 (-),score=21.92 GDKI01038993.1:83-400(-)
MFESLTTAVTNTLEQVKNTHTQLYESLPSLPTAMPSLQIPTVSLPAVSLPTVSLPAVPLPSVSLQSVKNFWPANFRNETVEPVSDETAVNGSKQTGGEPVAVGAN